MCKRNIFYISKTYTKYHNNYQTLKQTHCVNTIFVKVLILYSSLHIALFKFKPSWGKIFTDQTKGIIFERSLGVRVSVKPGDDFKKINRKRKVPCPEGLALSFT